jgi:hypothetical protein
LNPSITLSLSPSFERPSTTFSYAAAATFFTLGAIKQLLDNNKFLNTFDIIYATSGSVITLLLVEGVVPDWYEIYVVQIFHSIFNGNYIKNTM